MAGVTVRSSVVVVVVVVVVVDVVVVVVVVVVVLVAVVLVVVATVVVAAVVVARRTSRRRGQPQPRLQGARRPELRNVGERAIAPFPYAPHGAQSTRPPRCLADPRRARGDSDRAHDSVRFFCIA